MTTTRPCWIQMQIAKVLGIDFKFIELYLALEHVKIKCKQRI